MQISENTTGMKAELCISTDKNGVDHCTVVVKGTFDINALGEAELAAKQMDMVFADEHFGDPAGTSIRYECDFLPFKPKTDVIVNAKAVAPHGADVRILDVSLQIQHKIKKLKVYGDRYWRSGLLGVSATDPLPFRQMPIVYERAFGGSDHTHDNRKKQGTETRNPVGRGFFLNGRTKILANTPLPNIEDPRQRIKTWSQKPAPVGFGIIGRSWQPRIAYAGTYDQVWQDDKFPFLPDDFNDLYYQSAPADQQFDYFTGHEKIICTGMTHDHLFNFSVPKLTFPIRFVFRDRTDTQIPNLDTVLLEPNAGRAILNWRIRIPAGRKLNLLREIFIGPLSRDR